MSVIDYLPLTLNEDHARELDAHVLALEHALIDLKFAIGKADESGDYRRALGYIKQAQTTLVNAEAVYQRSGAAEKRGEDHQVVAPSYRPAPQPHQKEQAPSAQDVRIDITGCAGSGKTLLMQLVGHCLQQAGFNVRCMDDGSERDPSEGIEGLLADLRDFPPRPSLVSVATHYVCVGQSVELDGGQAAYKFRGD
jgi:chromosomal replication initiation ATPase DnaA